MMERTAHDYGYARPFTSSAASCAKNRPRFDVFKKCEEVLLKA